jgi:menaquinone-9 beta-reductase
MWDAIVIGAGPAGSVTARELARNGCRVLLVDKASFPRSKVCGCCLNGAAIRTLRRLGLEEVLEDAVPLSQVTIGAKSRKASLNLPAGVAISRELLDLRLVEAAVSAGVEFRPDTTVNRDSLLLKHAPVVILASGLTGGDAVPEPTSRIGAGVLLKADAVPGFYSPGTIYMATGRSGYVGLVRVEDGRLDIAAAFDASFVKSVGGLGRAAVAILAEVGWPIPHGLADLAWKGTPALTRRSLRLAERGLFVVGDAAGYVEPFTGEGMAWAVMSAEALAPIALRAVREWDDRLIHEWEQTHAGVVGRRQRVCRIVSRVLRSPRLTSLTVRSLRLFPILSRPVVAMLNRPSPQGSSV